MTDPKSPDTEIVPPGKPFIDPDSPDPVNPVQPGQPFIEPESPDAPAANPMGPAKPFIE